MTPPDPDPATAAGSGPPDPDGDPAKRRVFLVDDHPLVREWLTNLVNQQDDLVVCGEAEGAPQALAAIGQARPDAAVLDLSLRVGSGLELIKDLRQQCPEVALVVLSMHEEALYAERALRAGARGYVTKRETAKKILVALRRVLAGGTYVSESFAATLAERLVESGGRRAAAPPGEARAEVNTLSDRELEVFRLLGQGQSTAQIADGLRISLKTVQAYCARIKDKLGLHGLNELLRAAFRFEEGAGRGGDPG